MEKKNILFLIGMIMLTIINFHVAKSDNDSEIQTIIEAAKFISSSISTGKGNITYEWTRIDTLSMQKELNQYPQGTVGIVSHIITNNLSLLQNSRYLYNIAI